MGELDKLVEKFLRKPPGVLFEDVAKVLEAFGYEERPLEGEAIGSLPSPGIEAKLFRQ